ncbi:DeoR/GlpR family DNA-binding transcription regulator [Actinotalea sp. M2MS4P-6]|uniref:DeoR/GlpR family DNA-binding transcription regulator n=1 Tax=Actinotalea sp. M2MS4P-6 TaxID=2983762 RepID=UPI0021E477E1|nr:DeoR/GlpR family DNA-binding transcription regulator [Actinotalea sp. M2MS4P-6]MCV2393262.1 DeoR/GlpR family DNA-binding transcription regulator [Actinotalea sp. M2MS4P-6]
MLASERRQYLLDRLAAEGKIVAKQVARDLDLSEDSIRRDLRELAAEGLCQRVYGGALPASPAVAPYAQREAIEPAGKTRVARTAARLVTPGSTVIIDGGTTALALVAALPPSLECSVITHSPTIAAALVPHPRIDVTVIGGRLFKHSIVTCGSAALEAVSMLSADLCFIGVTGVHPERQLTTGDSEEAAMKRALARRSADTYVLASSEKIGAASQFQVAAFTDITAVITDAPADDPSVLALQQVGVPLIHAG